MVLNIFKVGDEYRAVIQAGENPQPTSKGQIIYQDGMESKSNHIRHTRNTVRKLQERARKWAREQEIKFICNLDINSYS